MGIPMEAEQTPPELVDVPVPVRVERGGAAAGEGLRASTATQERALARLLLARLARRAPQRVSRRTRPTRRRRDVHDLRATVRASLRHGGELLERRYREPAQRPRRLVLVCDVSGSMTPYARMLLQYMQASVTARTRVEAFVFGTRLTRVTRELAGRDPDRALARAAEHVTDWSGGTRIGAALAELNREHGRRIGRGAIIVVLSDGWDRGDPDVLAAEMARLRRCAYRVLWLNPLAADPRYEPLTRGMQAALPHVDHLLPGNSIASLEALARTHGGRTVMKDVLEDVDAWTARGDAVALATVISVKRSAPRPPGSKMAINEHGEISGAVSGGCVEGAVVEVAERGAGRQAAAAAALRHRRRGGVGRRAAVRRRDRRVRGALRAVSAQSAFAELARSGGRGALVTEPRDGRREAAGPSRRPHGGHARRPRARRGGGTPRRRADVGRALRARAATCSSTSRSRRRG